MPVFFMMKNTFTWGTRKISSLRDENSVSNITNSINN
jgi:hypothetical protein